MNEKLLQSIVVKSSVSRYLRNGLTFEEVKFKLYDIHFIDVSDAVLEEYISETKKELQNKN